MLVPYDLSTREPELFEYLAHFQQPRRSEPFQNLKSKWTRSGPGPVALIGNLWHYGVMLAPEYLQPTTSVVSAISYAWDDSKILAWAPHTTVRLLVTDVHSMETWASDVTRSSQGTLILPANTGVSANCQAVFEMSAGKYRGRLKAPPFIPSAEITVRYKY